MTDFSKTQLIYLPLVILFLFGGNRNELTAQTSLDSTKTIEWEYKKEEFKRSLYWAIPIAALGGISKTENNFFSNSIFEDVRNDRFGDFESHLDDYLAAAPIGAVFAIDLFSRDSRHDLLNQSLLLVKSELIMSAFVFPIKAWSKQIRPDGSNDQSFPSGHTAQAFVSATFLHKEYGHKSIWYSIAAYTTASTVGIYRVLNNQHFVSDILVGASIGILSTNLAYLTHLNAWGKKKPYQRKWLNNVSFMPSYVPANYTNNSTGTIGFNLSLNL